MSRKDSKERTETSRKESERTKDDGRILTLKDKKRTLSDHRIWEISHRREMCGEILISASNIL